MTEHGYDAEMATIYDATTAGRDDDVEFYVERATAAEGRVLELAVGTGRVYLEVLDAGADADGVDVAPEMLAVLRERAAERGLEPSVWVGDMTDLAGTTGRAIAGEYDLVYCPFNALQHARSVDAQQAVFASVYEALAPGGRFVFDVFVPSFELIEATYGEWQSRTVPFDGEDHELRTRTRFVDEPRQVVEVENRLVDPAGEVRHETSHRISPLPYQQVELLARASPFETWSVRGGFDGGALEDGDAVQIWTLERAN